MPNEEKIKTGIYLLVFTSPVTHTYLYNINTKGTLEMVASMTAQVTRTPVARVCHIIQNKRTTGQTLLLHAV
jgi:hypothetical protein